MKRKTFKTLALGLAFHTLFSGYTPLPNGQIDWRFLLGSYAGQYDAQGIPNNISALPRKTYPDSFWNNLSQALPERVDIRQNVNAAGYITEDEGANITLQESGEVFLTFLHEGAGYKNSVGFFTYDPNNPPQTKEEVIEKVVFPNSSFYNSGGGPNGLRNGDTVKLGDFNAGTKIGFVVVSNGWDSTQGVKPNQDKDWIFYTLKHLNSETDNTLKPHTVLLYDQDNQAVVLGLEDILRTNASCDHDFNDVMFTVTSNPPQAINSGLLKSLPEATDSDGDGVFDSEDAFPNDAKRAFAEFYPAANRLNTLAFEDNWPSQGDYDMNDLVLKYQFKQVLNSQNLVKDIQGQFKLMARGAELHNTFALNIPGVVPGNVAQLDVTYNGESLPVQIESGQSSLVFTIIPDASEYSKSQSGCQFFNTESNCPVQEGGTFDFKLTLNTPVSKINTGLPPYNPFIYRKDQRGLEVHLPDHLPTDKASTQLFGRKDDNSSAGNNRFYKTKSNLPWALDIPSDWSHPSEKAEVSRAYPEFKPWAESAGVSYKRWYGSQIKSEYLYGNS